MSAVLDLATLFDGSVYLRRSGPTAVLEVATGTPGTPVPGVGTVSLTAGDLVGLILTAVTILGELSGGEPERDALPVKPAVEHVNATPVGVTAARKVAPKPGRHVDYPHAPGTLYDCPACDL